MAETLATIEETEVQAQAQAQTQVQYVFVTYESMMLLYFNICSIVHQYVMYYFEQKMYDEFYLYKNQFDRYAWYYNYYKNYIEAIE